MFQINSMRSKYSILILLLFSLICSAQPQKRDSIVQDLNNSTHQDSIVLLYSKLAKSYEKINLDSAIYYSQKGYDLALKSRYYLGIAENAANLGLFNILKNDLDQAEVHYASATENYLKANSLFKSIQNKMRIGNINLAQNNHINAIKIYQECLTISKENDFILLLPHLYNNLGLLYLEIEDYDDAQKNFELAHKLFLENNDDASATVSLSNIALIQSNLGEYEEAVKGLLKCCFLPYKI